MASHVPLKSFTISFSGKWVPLIECALIASCKFPRCMPIRELGIIYIGVPTRLVEGEEKVNDLSFAIWILNHSRVLEAGSVR